MAFFNRKKKDEEKKEEEAPKPASVTLPTAGYSASYRVIVGPHVTEKASGSSAMGKYVFRVTPQATKIDVKRAIEKLYKVSVKNVHMVSMPSKVRRVGRHVGKRSGFKKAIVSLKPGNTIDITG